MALNVPDPPTGEEECGLLGFASSTPGIGGKLRAVAEDFVVEEAGHAPPRAEGGAITVMRIRARNWETNRLVKQMSKRLRISSKRVRFAGVKDKRAVTTQLITVEAPLEALLALRMPDVEVLEAWPTSSHISLGDHTSNRFDIAVTRLAVDAEAARARIDGVMVEIGIVGGFPNFYGVQRFGVHRPISHVVGRHLVRGDAAAACWAYLTQVGVNEDAECAAARAALAETRDVRTALRDFPKALGYERTLLDHLLHHPEDSVGALERLPFNLQLMFVHAYQGLLFNLVLSERLRRGMPLATPVEGDIVVPVGPDGVPEHSRPVPVTAANLEKVAMQAGRGRALVTGLVPGTGAPVAEGEVGDIERAVLAAEGLSSGDFRIPGLPNLTSEGLRRSLLLTGVRPDTSIESDRARFQFSLPKGTYATTVLREFMKSPIMSY